MNIERLNQVIDWLEAGAPERIFDMRCFTNVGLMGEPPENWCGTSCCIGGYAVTAFVHKTPQDYFEKTLDIAEEAQKALGLSRDTANALFYVLDKGGERGFQSSWDVITADQAAKAVRNVIEFDDPKWTEILDPNAFS